jgi:chloramphenicol 3-O phosphotransferase
VTVSAGAEEVALPPVEPGRILLLNGTSSSGKTSIAEQLLDVLPTPYFHFSVDVVNSLRAKRRTAELSPEQVDIVLRRTRAGFHRAMVGMAEAGNDLVVDYLFSERWRLLDCLVLTRHLDVVFVGIHCDLDELTRREAERGDRIVGAAAAQLSTVHEHGGYDIECDTTLQSPADCARHIADALADLPTTRVFDVLRERLLPQ